MFAQWERSNSPIAGVAVTGFGIRHLPLPGDTSRRADRLEVIETKGSKKRGGIAATSSVP